MEAGPRQPVGVCRGHPRGPTLPGPAGQCQPPAGVDAAEPLAGPAGGPSRPGAAAAPLRASLAAPTGSAAGAGAATPHGRPHSAGHGNEAHARRATPKRKWPPGRQWPRRGDGPLPRSDGPVPGPAAEDDRGIPHRAAAETTPASEARSEKAPRRPCPTGDRAVPADAGHGGPPGPGQGAGPAPLPRLE